MIIRHLHRVGDFFIKDENASVVSDVIVIIVRVRDDPLDIIDVST